MQTLPVTTNTKQIQLATLNVETPDGAYSLVDDHGFLCMFDGARVAVLPQTMAGYYNIVLSTGATVEGISYMHLAPLA
jgi:hypothetical protein